MFHFSLHFFLHSFLRFCLGFFSLLFLLGVLGLAYLCHPKFGGTPSKQDLERIKQSKNYYEGQFQNLDESQNEPQQPLRQKLYLSKQEVQIQGQTSPQPPSKRKTLLNLFFQSNKGIFVPSVLTDFKTLDPHEDICVWFGHSSYFLQIERYKVLVDPVLNGFASPFPFLFKAFPGSHLYHPEDLPEIDLLIITHDHWDHLDYETLKKIKCKQIVCPLGVGAHLKRWGFSNFVELDWDEEWTSPEGFHIDCLTSKHFSGRSFKRNQTLWASFLLTTPLRFKIFLGCDGGYGPHFTQFGEKFGPINIAFLENGQYNVFWPAIHMFPHQTLQAAKDLKALAVIPIHNSKFRLAPHTWTEPMEKLKKLQKTKGFEGQILFPKIGEKILLTQP